MRIALLESASIERIVEGLKSSNEDEREASYRETIRRYGRLIHVLSRRFTTDPGLAEDVFQESFLRLFRKIHLLTEPKAFPGFFRRIVLSAIYDCLTRHREKTAEPADLAKLAYEFDTAYLDVFFLIPYLNRLPQLQREIIGLEFFRGLNSLDVAKELGISRVSARVNRHRALSKLRTWLEEDANILKPKAKKKGKA